MSSARIGIVCNRLAKGGGMESHALGLVAEFSALGMMPVIFTLKVVEYTPHSISPRLNS